MEKHKDRARWRKRWIPYLGILLMVVCGILGTEYVAGLATQRVLESQQRETQAQLSELRARIESEINSVLYLTRGLSAYIVARPDAAPGELEIIASHILRGSQHIRNIGLAPDNVVRFVYPRQGNEAVLGLNYEKDRRQWPAILQAIDRNDTMVAGPLELVQGGTGLIARTPIFVDEGKDSRYWGMSSVVIDIESVLRAAGVYEQELGPLAIRHVDTLGADQDQFWGDEGIFETEGVQTQVVSFRRNWWQLGVVPRARGALAAGLRVKALSYGLLLAMVALSLQLVRIFHRAEERATRDPLTALPNRRLLLERARQLVSLSNRSGLGFGLCYVDLNGFKPVNDKLGHHAGDAVLLEVAKRLLGALRQSDTVARTGGDEFVILLPLMQGADEARQVIRKLAQALEPPISYRGHQIDIGASFGCALYPTDAENLEALMAVADTRMYEMKAYSKQA